ncbi:MAG TPA: hypothetical protein VLX85_01230 [Stellaceae bacterium]|nr:hypothetical protein [Stellaceae bacterium]
MARRQKHGADETLTQADLSHLRLQDMTPEQRAELRRRYDAFVRHFGEGAPAAGAAASKKSAPRKWVPGAKR